MDTRGGETMGTKGGETMDTRGWQKGVPSDLAFTVYKRPDFGSPQIEYPTTHESHNSSEFNLSN